MHRSPQLRNSGEEGVQSGKSEASPSGGASTVLALLPVSFPLLLPRGNREGGEGGGEVCNNPQPEPPPLTQTRLDLLKENVGPSTGGNKNSPLRRGKSPACQMGPNPPAVPGMRHAEGRWTSGVNVGPADAGRLLGHSHRPPKPQFPPL